MPLGYTIEYVRRLLREIKAIKSDYGVTTDQVLTAMVTGAILAALKMKYEHSTIFMEPDRW